MQDLLHHKSQIEAALVYAFGGYTFDDVVAEVINGAMFFYPLGSSFVIACVQTMPRKKQFVGVFAGGDLHTLIDFEPVLIEHAKALGCSSICISGRKGWERTLVEHGYTNLCISMDKEI
jgi:hypothetical protein